MRRVFERGLGKPTGFVLPIQRWNAAAAAAAGAASAGRCGAASCILVPGDSPLGLRLPIKSLPYVPADDYPGQSIRTIRRSPRAPLPTAAHFRETRPQRLRASRAVPSPTRAVRTALTVEVRDGFLCVFMPPTERLEDYLEILATVETIAKARNTPVRIEGYTPPPDSRLNVIKVTPDPGVIEVNVHPANSWREAVDNTTALYEEARLARLGTDKYLVDGRHTGTGGGNHVVLGGATPAEFAVPAPAGSAGEPHPLLAAPSLAELPVLRPVHRPDQSGAAARRGARRSVARVGDRARAGAAARRRRAAVDRRPAVPQPAGRRHRQHPSRGNLHRQALFARQRHRPARAGRVPLVRDAARRAHERSPSNC